MTASRLPDLAGFRSVLIVKPSSLGDIVHTLPAVQALHAAHPQLHVRWVANPEWLPLLEGAPWLTEAIPFPRKRFRGLAGLWRFWKWTRTWRRLPRELPELVLDFQGLLRSGLMAKTRGSGPIIGLSDAREGAHRLHDHVVPVDRGAHAVDRYLTLVRALGVAADASILPLQLPEGSRPAGWPESEGLIVLHPWSRGAGKSLSPEVLQALCDALAPQPVVLVGMPAGQPVPRGAHLTDLSNRTTLAELLWGLRRARAVVSVDSGPMHMAAAVNDFTLGLHTWSDPRQVGPYNPRARVWKAGRIASRLDFTSEECLADRQIELADVPALATFIRTFGDRH